MQPQQHWPERRSGLDRRADEVMVADGGGRRLDPSASRAPSWPLDVAPGWAHPRPRDPWADVVQRSIDAYRSGRIDELRQTWDESITWRVTGGRGGPVLADHATGPDGVFEFHRQLVARTNGTFRQRLISLEGSQGPIVEAHVRTTASRRGRSLDQPCLLVFELSAGRIHSVKEIPGDCSAWDRFWAD
jgi:ketosteroid isomerase-like protein